MTGEDPGRLLGTYAGVRSSEGAEAWTDKLNRLAREAVERVEEPSPDEPVVDGDPAVTGAHIPKLSVAADPATGQPRCARPGCNRPIGEVRMDGLRRCFGVNPYFWSRDGDGWWSHGPKRDRPGHARTGSLEFETVFLPALFVCKCGARQVADPATFDIAEPYGAP